MSETANFSVSDRAAERIAEIVGAERTPLRVAVLAGGCSGFQYKFELDPAVQADDLVIDKGGARVLVDPASLDLLAGAELHFSDALMGSHFTGAQPQCNRKLRVWDVLLGRLKQASHDLS